MESPAGISDSPKLRWSGCTDPGRFRSNNEDAFLALTFDGREVKYLGKEGDGPQEGSDYVFAVSDGMGGANAGEVASRIAVDKIIKLLPKSFTLGAQIRETGFADVLEELFLQTHASLRELSQHYEECRGMGATLSLCWFMPGSMAFCHAGDSRIYYLPKDGEMIQLTHDHTQVGRLFRCGTINEREARTHPHRNILSQVLGGGIQHLDPQIGRLRCHPGDRFLVCSDGLVDGMWDRRIDEMGRGEFSAQKLVDFAVSESGRDNTTAVLVEVL